MPVLVTPIQTAGAVATPSGVIPFALPTAESQRFHPGLPVSVARLPGLRGGIRADGYSRLHHFIDTTIYRTGGLAPSAAPTVTPTAVRATALLDLDVVGNGASIYNPGTDATDVMVMGPGFVSGGITVYPTFAFATVLTAQDSVIVVLKGSTGADTLDNIQDVITGDNEGITWVGPSNVPDMVSILRANVEIASHPTTYQATFRSIDYGTSGNAFRAYFSTGTWTDSALGSSTAGTVGTVNYFASGTAGSGSAPEAGKYRYLYTHVRTVDGAETGPSPIAETQQGVAANIEVDGMAANADTTFDFVRVYRTEDTGEEFFPVDDVARALSGSPDYTDSTPNGEDDGSLQGYGVAAYDETAFLNYRGGFPPRGRFIVTWKGQVWTGGAFLAADYTAGTANVTNASASVTLSTTAVPTEDMIGDTFQVDSTAETYVILAVAEATRVLTLDRTYEGTTNTTAGYTISDRRDPSKVHASESLLFNQWPPRSPGRMDEDGDDEGLTGGVAMDDELVLFTRTTMHRITGEDPDTWQVHRVPGGPGCWAHATIVKVRLSGATGIMWLSPEGLFFYGGGGSAPINLSSEGDDSGIDGTLDRLNRQHAHLCHARVSPTERAVEVYVPLDDDVVPSHAIVYDLNGRRWSGPDRVSDITATGFAHDETGVTVPILGDRMGAIWQADLGTSDGGYGSYEPVQTLDANADERNLSTGITPFPTAGDGLDAVPVVVVYADGTYAYNKCAFNTNGTVVLAYDLAVAPAAADQFVVGCIHMIAETGRIMVGDGREKLTVKRLLVLHAPDSDGQYHVALASDQDTPSVPTDGPTSGDFTDTTGRGLFNFPDRDGRGMLHKAAIHVLEPGIEAAFIGYGFDGDTRE